MGPKTWKIISQLRDYCDLQYGRRSEVARTLVLELLSSQESENRKRSRAVITIGDRIERYTTLSEAVTAARNWYSKLAGKKLPEWNYRIQSVDDFAEAIDNYKARIAKSLGYGRNYQQSFG